MPTAILQIFAKVPKAGKVKTRLIPEFGAKKACQIYQQILRQTVENALCDDSYHTELWLDGSGKYLNNNIKNNLYLYEQKGKLLGDKMHNALVAGLARADKVILIGTDCPQLGPQHYIKSIKMLEQNDIVLGPTLDGGYCLIGVKKIDRKLFDNIKWSTDGVYQDTLTAINQLGWRSYSLKTLRDIDTAEDYNWHKKHNYIRDVI